MNVCCEAVCAIFCRYICLSDLNLLKCLYLSIFSWANSANIKCWPGNVAMCGKWQMGPRQPRQWGNVFCIHNSFATCVTEVDKNIRYVSSSPPFSPLESYVKTTLAEINRLLSCDLFLLVGADFSASWELIDFCNFWTPLIFMVMGLIPITLRPINLLSLSEFVSALTYTALMRWLLIGWQMLLLVSHWLL